MFHGEGIIFDERNGAIVQSYRTIGAARGAFTRKYSKQPDLKVCTYDEYKVTGAVFAAELVEVINIIGGNPIMIRRDEVGGCCDPSTERYHCM